MKYHRDPTADGLEIRRDEETDAASQQPPASTASGVHGFMADPHSMACTYLLLCAVVGVAAKVR